MFTFGKPRKQLIINKSLNDYCMKSTQESIKKIIEKSNLERNKEKINNILDDNDENKKPELNLYSFFIFLSISSIGFILYKRLN